MISSTGILTINLSAIQSNWLFVKSQLSAITECAAVVKADAYGVGAIEVSQALYAAGCRHFYVATFEEASDIRGVLSPDAAIYVFGGAPLGAETHFTEKSLIPVLYSLTAIRNWAAYCQSCSTLFPCVIKVDSGMGRLGLSEIELNQFMQDSKLHSCLFPVLVITHLACADDPTNTLNNHQLESFLTILSLFKRVFPAIKSSIANSSGVFLDKSFHMDMVRVGAALYGINPQQSRKNPLSNIIELKLPVFQLRRVVQDTCVGYGAEGIVSKGALLAVVAGGYADGIHRTLGFVPLGRAAGHYVKAVGRVSMDSTIFDVSLCESPPDYIHVVDDVITLDLLMKNNKTLGYEVLTSLGARFQRRYKIESTPQ